MSAKELGHVRSTAEKVEAALNTIKNAGCHDVDAFYLSPSKEDLEAAVVEAALAWRKVYRRYDGGERGWPIVGDLDDAKDALDSAADALLAFLEQGEAAK